MLAGLGAVKACRRQRDDNVRDRQLNVFSEARCLRYPIPTQAAGNALVTLLKSRVSMDSDDHLWLACSFGYQ
ncbi:hypothetical protein EVAR_75003_1 [Eumeta japonica]|uniref:Uncharacterized protein n=1 Tax=Eumeta variegata TaxID=151549 RepID=A0A4C1V9T3_EUMVA|nr:hypothetical protein EVAR_75003_1 [Eumeta japonica]